MGHLSPIGAAFFFESTPAKGDTVEKQTNAHDAYRYLLASSYLEEQREIMLGILEYTPKLDERIDIASLERGEWSFNEPEWRLDDGTTFDPIERLLFFPPVNFIIALLKAPFLSLYDCIFLIDKITRNNALSNAEDIVYQALTNKAVAPRDPETNLKLIDLPSKSLKGAVKIPDLSWLLSFEEAETWAVNSFGISFKEYRDKLENEILEMNGKSNKPLDPKTDKPLDQRLEDSLLKIIAALCQKAGVAPDEFGLAKELQEITGRLGVEISYKTISKHLKSAAKIIS